MDANTRKVLEECRAWVGEWCMEGDTPSSRCCPKGCEQNALWRKIDAILAAPDDAVGELRMDAERFRFMADAVMKATGVDIRIGVDEKMRAAEQTLAATSAASNVKKGKP